MLTCGRDMMTGWFPAKDTGVMGPDGPGSYPGFAMPIDMASSQNLVVGWPEMPQCLLSPSRPIHGFSCVLSASAL